MFRDECEIEVAAGKGGDGLVSFRREKFMPKGGPDGGDGGDGGDVILHATERVTSLLAIGRRRRYAASDGRPGGPNDRSGARGDDVRIEVPVGTQVLFRIWKSRGTHGERKGPKIGVARARQSALGIPGALTSPE